MPLENAPIFYQASHPSKPTVSITHPETGNEWVWRLKIGRFMPRWVSRLTLELTAVRVERLQAISESDAAAEGCVVGKVSGDAYENMAGLHFGGDEWASAKDWYADLWESINGPESWDANPWVWCLAFKVHQSNVDALLRTRAA